MGRKLTTQPNRNTLSELEFGEALHIGAKLFTHYAFHGKRVRSLWLRQARPRVAVRRGKRYGVSRTLVLIESNANDKKRGEAERKKCKLPEPRQERIPVYAAKKQSADH
ncbi:MAG: hypothetical protein COB24_07670 [Hyphomicrobiales bacterium]|nr:MAG: hypothetical protein COB24_07670 [Hyphomicrobiales bacterium]